MGKNYNEVTSIPLIFNFYFLLATEKNVVGPQISGKRIAVCYDALSLSLL